MDYYKRQKFERGKFYLPTTPSFGTLSCKIKNKTFFYPMKVLNDNTFQENIVNIDITGNIKDSFYIISNSYNREGYLIGKIFKIYLKFFRFVQN